MKLVRLDMLVKVLLKGEVLRRIEECSVNNLVTLSLQLA